MKNYFKPVSNFHINICIQLEFTSDKDGNSIS